MSPSQVLKLMYIHGCTSACTSDNSNPPIKSKIRDILETSIKLNCSGVTRNDSRAEIIIDKFDLLLVLLARDYLRTLSDLPHANVVISVTRKQCGAIRGPSQGDALGKEALCARELGLQFIHNCLVE